MRQARVIRYLVVAALLLLLGGLWSVPRHAHVHAAPAGRDPTRRGGAGPGPGSRPGPGPAGAKPGGPGAAAGEPLGATWKAARRPRRPAKERAVPPPSTPSSPKPAVSSAAADKNYTEGMRLYHAKKYAEARHQLYQYLKNQPKGPKAPEARYYLADSFYQEGKYQEAGVEFNKLRLQSPKSILAPAGLLRQALCYKNQQQMGTYRSTLQKLVKAYPNSPEAKEAQKMLKESPKEATR